MQQLEDYIEKHEEGLITAFRNDTENTMDNRNKNGKKNNLWAFKTTNKQDLKQENVDAIKKSKHLERNRISPNNSTNQYHKKQLYQSENLKDATK